MKSFHEFREDPEQNLDESAIRSGGILMWASKAKTSGDSSLKAFQRSKEALRGSKSGKSVEQRLDALTEALGEIATGLQHQRHQIGHTLSAVVTASLMKQSGRKR